MKIKLVKAGAYATAKQTFLKGREYEVSKEEFEALPKKEWFEVIESPETNNSGDKTPQDESKLDNNQDTETSDTEVIQNEEVKTEVVEEKPKAGKNNSNKNNKPKGSK